MEIKKVLWLEDQYDGFRPYRSMLFRAGYMVDYVASVTDAEKKISENKEYVAYIFDIKVLAGNDEKWKNRDEEIRNKTSVYDSHLGLELLRSLFLPDNQDLLKLSANIHHIDPKRVIVFSVLSSSQDIRQELLSFGIPEKQIVYKGKSKLTTLPDLVKKIVDEDYER